MLLVKRVEGPSILYKYEGQKSAKGERIKPKALKSYGFNC
jgi:hypothetical protein